MILGPGSARTEKAIVTEYYRQNIDKPRSIRITGHI